MDTFDGTILDVIYTAKNETEKELIRAVAVNDIMEFCRIFSESRGSLPPYRQAIRAAILYRRMEVIDIINSRVAYTVILDAATEALERYADDEIIYRLVGPLSVFVNNTATVNHQAHSLMTFIAAIIKSGRTSLIDHYLVNTRIDGLVQYVIDNVLILRDTPKDMRTDILFHVHLRGYRTHECAINEFVKSPIHSCVFLRSPIVRHQYNVITIAEEVRRVNGPIVRGLVAKLLRGDGVHVSVDALHMAVLMYRLPINRAAFVDVHVTADARLSSTP